MDCKKPEAIANISVKLTSPTSFDLKWSEAKLANKYVVEYREGSRLRLFSITNRFCTIRNLKTDTEYSFRVFGKNVCGNGDYSPLAFRKTQNNIHPSEEEVSISSRSEPNTLSCPTNIDMYVYSEIRSFDLSHPFANYLAITGEASVGGVCIMTSADEEVTAIESEGRITVSVPKNHFIGFGSRKPHPLVGADECDPCL